MMRILFVLGSFLALAGSAALAFIAALYAPKWFWIVSFGSIALAALLKAFIFPAFRKTILAAAVSVVANGHFLFLLINAPSPQLVGYFFAFVLGQFLLLYLAFWLMERASGERQLRAR